MRLLNLMVAALSLMCFTSAFADDVSVAPVPTYTVSPDDLVKEVARLKSAQATANASGDKTAMMAAIAAAIALVLKVTIDAVQQWKDLSDKAMKAIPLVCSVLSAIVIALDKFAGGDSWLNALILGGGPLAAVVVNELHNALKKSPPTIAPLKPEPLPDPAAPKAA